MQRYDFRADTFGHRPAQRERSLHGEYIKYSDVAQLEDEIEAWKAERHPIDVMQDGIIEEQAAHIERLRDSLDKVNKEVACKYGFKHACFDARKLLESTPKQSLAHIKAEAIKEMLIAVSGSTMYQKKYCSIDRLKVGEIMDYIEQLKTKE